MSVARLGCLVLLAAYSAAAAAQLVVRDDDLPRVANPADQVPYPTGALDCRDTIADVFARGVVRAIDDCPTTFFESRQAYIAYARTAVTAIFIPGGPEAAAALALDKARENALFCISDALVDASGASDADKAFMKSLVTEAKELADRAEGAKKLAELGAALEEKGLAAYDNPDLNTFVNSLDVTLKERYDGRRTEGGLIDAGNARNSTAESRARAATAAAETLGSECRYSEAEAALAQAQRRNLEYLAELRARVARAKHHQFCLERDSRRQRVDALNPPSPFLRHSLDVAQADVDAAERDDAEETRYIGELAELQASFHAKRNDVDALRKAAARRLESARAAAAQCDWERAANALDTLNVETLPCALQLDAERRESGAVAEQIAEVKRQLGALDGEYAKAIATPFEQIDSCGTLSVFADTVDQFQGQCRVIASIDAKVAALRGRARECADAKTAARLTPGALVGKVEVQPEKLDVGGAGAYTKQTYGASSHSFERVIPSDPSRVAITWNYEGVPSSLSPGQAVTITVSGGVVAESPKDAAAGYALSGVVAVYGDVKVNVAQQADRGHPTGRYEFVVNPNAQNVEIHLGGSPMGTGAVWKYAKPR